MTTTAAGTVPPDDQGPVAPVVPLRVPRPKAPQAAGILGVTAAAFAVAAVRPKQVPAPLQRAADVTTAVVVFGHPVEAYLVNKAARRAGITRRERRRVTFSTLALGVFTSARALWVLRRAYPQR